MVPPWEVSGCGRLCPMLYASETVATPPDVTQPTYMSLPAIVPVVPNPNEIQPVEVASIVKVMEVLSGDSAQARRKSPPGDVYVVPVDAAASHGCEPPKETVMEPSYWCLATLPKPEMGRLACVAQIMVMADVSEMV